MNTDILLTEEEIKKIRDWERGLTEAGTSSGVTSELARLKIARLKLERLSELIKKVSEELS